MVRDPLYREIERRLEEGPNPDDFERCVVDLLRAVYPGLVPIRGGDDGGMDGAISDTRRGPPTPLVVTTGEDVIGNLTKNLKSYRGDGGTAGEAVVATSQALTRRRRTNLAKRAREMGFVLRNIHDQADFVGRLYRHPAWRRELLGLTGDPPALSAFPGSPRGWPTQQLLGRDEESTWLRQTNQDAVIAGQPGVGKTALLSDLAKEGYGLFVVSRDIGKIADAYRELSPSRLFVDDAHLDSVDPLDSLLGKLLRLRRDLGMTFQIMATTWPGHEIDIRRTLYPADDQVLRVKPLEQATMVEIVRGVNPRFPDELIAEILDQSEGRPGLAVTLAQWAQRGELKDLVNGQLLLREIARDLPRPDSTLDALAPFALAGTYGMTLPAAAQPLGWPGNDLRAAFRPVSGTGILQEADHSDPDRRFISVKPEALRVALVERAYFSGVLSMPVTPALEHAGDSHACTYTLIQVLDRGGGVPHGLIRRRLEELHRVSWPGGVWERYVGTGEEAARWVLETHPDKILSVGRAALAVVPDIALDNLLDDSGEGNVGTNDPTRVIDSWIRSGLPGRDAAERRIRLIERLAAHIRSARGEYGELWSNRRFSETGLFRAAFSLEVSAWRANPLDDMTLLVTSGSLRGNEVRELARVWPTALDALRVLGDDGVRCARQIVEEWTVRLLIRGENPETYPAAKKQAPRMLQDVIELADGAPGVVMWAHRLVRHRKLVAELPALDDPLLDKLFPDIKWGDSFPDELVLASARALVDEWRREDPQTVARRMMYYERQRELADHFYPNVLKHLPHEIAERVDEPSEWLRAFLDQRAPGSWAQPLLEAAIVASPASDTPWELVAHDKESALVCARVGLSLPGLPESAVALILEAVRRVVAVRHDLVPWGDLSHEWQCRLLRDTNARVRAAAAAGLWRVHGGTRPSGTLGRLLWDAIVESGDASLLQELLGADRMVARAWVLQQARASSTQRSRRETPPPWEEVELPSAEGIVHLGDLSPWRYSELLRTAIASLTVEDRRDLILAIPIHADERLFGYLVGTDPDLYRVLLKRNVPRSAHLGPLRVGPSEGREALIRVAREHGYADCGSGQSVSDPRVVDGATSVS